MLLECFYVLILMNCLIYLGYVFLQRIFKPGMSDLNEVRNKKHSGNGFV